MSVILANPLIVQILEFIGFEQLVYNGFAKNGTHLLLNYIESPRKELQTTRVSEVNSINQINNLNENLGGLKLRI